MVTAGWGRMLLSRNSRVNIGVGAEDCVGFVSVDMIWILDGVRGASLFYETFTSP